MWVFIYLKDIYLFGRKGWKSLTTKPYRECPRYNKCSVNNCPLHPIFPELYLDPEDSQLKCTLEKEVRFRIGSKYPNLLKFQGLTPREWAGKKRFEGLTDQDKELVRDRARRAIRSACQPEVTLDGVRLTLPPSWGRKKSIN